MAFRLKPFKLHLIGALKQAFIPLNQRWGLESGTWTQVRLESPLFGTCDLLETWLQKTWDLTWDLPKKLVQTCDLTSDLPQKTWYFLWATCWLLINCGSCQDHDTRFHSLAFVTPNYVPPIDSHVRLPRPQLLLQLPGRSINSMF